MMIETEPETLAAHVFASDADLEAEEADSDDSDDSDDDDDSDDSDDHSEGANP